MGVVTTVHSLKGNISDAIDYILDDEKTIDGVLTGSNNCRPRVAGKEWKCWNERNLIRDGSEQTNNIVGYHFIQSFDDPAVTPEMCYQLAKEWIEKCTENNFNYVIAVHQNTQHVHAHIIVNAYNNITDEKWDIFYKRDLNLFKQFNNEVCEKYGIETFDLDNTSNKNLKNNSWWLHHKQIIGDNHDTIIKKSLDYLINNVQSYEQLKTYLEHIGYEVEDGGEYVPNQNLNLENYSFSLNQKMINEELSDDYSFFIRIPYTQLWMQIPKENAEWNDNQTTLKCNLNFNGDYIVMDKNANIINENYQGILIADCLDSKNKDKIGRQGLRIKPPGAKKFRRCDRILNDEGDKGDYSLESVKQRILSNNVEEINPAIYDVLSLARDVSRKKINKEKNLFYENADIKTQYNQSEFYQMSGYEKFLHYKSKEIQATLDKMSATNKSVNDYINISSLKTLERSLRNDLKEINEALRNAEKTLSEMQSQKMEGILLISENEIDNWIDKNIAPLKQEKFKLKKQSHEVKERIKNAEKTREELR